MAYQSVDQLQNVLAGTVFHYTKDAKKASGRALGTLVEIITFYLLKSWGFEHSVAVERPLPEYGNRGISHNVEYSLHPILRGQELVVDELKLPLTAAKLLTEAEAHGFTHTGFSRNNTTLLATNGVLRNACTIGTRDGSHLVATLDSKTKGGYKAQIVEQFTKPYAIFECKRVGIEEGMKKGPQTIEKAKQGAYVAKSVSSLHKLRKGTGELQGLMFKDDGSLLSGPYEELILKVIQYEGPELLRDFILTVGVVSNHGNWFNSDDHNKELKVLAQSYDWLLFLTDEGLSEFIHELLLEPEPLLQPAREAFIASYTSDKKHNQFTKVQMEYEADQVLQAYFKDNEARIESWFNVITPRGRGVPMLQNELSMLRGKNWEKVHGI